MRDHWCVTVSRQDQPPHPLPPVQRGDGGEDRDGGGEAALRRLHGQLLHQDALLEQCPSHWEGVVPSGLSQDSYRHMSKYYLYLSTSVSTRAVAGSHQLDCPAEAAQQPGGGQGRAEEDQVCRAHGAAGPYHHHRSALVLESRVTSWLYLQTRSRPPPLRLLSPQTTWSQKITWGESNLSGQNTK